MFRCALLSLLALSTACAGTSRALQNQQFTGTVKTNLGNAVAGATVTIKAFYYDAQGGGLPATGPWTVTAGADGTYTYTDTWVPNLAVFCTVYVSATNPRDSMTGSNHTSGAGVNPNQAIETNVTIYYFFSPSKRPGKGPGQAGPAAPSRRPARVAE
jgi:hypothetical protein